MEIAEIKDLLNKMDAFVDDDDSLDSVALMQDPIVLNRLAVELLQQVDRDSKPELVIAPEGVEVKKNEKTILVLDSYSEEKANALVSLAQAEGVKVVAILSLTGSESHIDHGCAFHSLL